MTYPSDEDFVTHAFSSLQPVDASPTLRRRVAQIPIEHARSTIPIWPLSQLWQTVAAFVALLAIGTWAGSLETETSSTPQEVASLSSPDGHAFSRETATVEATADSTQIAASEDAEDVLEGLFALSFSAQWDDWDSELLGEEDPSEAGAARQVTP